MWTFAHGFRSTSPIRHASAASPFGPWLLGGWGAYEVALLAWRSTTFGKSWVNLQVESNEGTLSYRQVLMRTTAKFVFLGPLISGQVPLAVGMIGLLVDAAPLLPSTRRIALHDWVASTRVTRVNATGLDE